MRSSFHRAVIVFAVTLSLATGCGGGDDDAEPPAGDTADDTADDTANDTAGDATDDSGDDATSDVTAPSAVTAPTEDDTTDGGDGDGGSGPVDCDGLFSLAEIEEWFGEPAQLTEDYNASLGQTVCTWETIEDPEDLEDLAFSLIVAQVYGGDPISGSNFVDPDVFEDVRMLDGIGDLAFSSSLLGTDYAFLDGEVAGFFSSTEVDMGNVDAEKRHTAEETEAMFRRFHERVMG